MATTVTRTMSDRPSQTRSGSSSSKRSISVRPTPPPSTLTPENPEQSFEPCAATGSFLLYAQRNVILVLHHDTLAIERRFERHREDIKWIAVDNISEQGAGRTAVSYDAGHSTVIWDILTGHEIARFVAYDTINVAHFMRNGNIAFGNAQGTIILFEPSTDENVCARTIFDPITALAPASDNRTFAIGYLNGSILIATLQPAFTILHTLTTSRAPSKITGLAWHGSSSKQKTDMLATQTADGDLRVWSVPKPPQHDPPTIIRALSRSDIRQPGPSWFAWSKNGRLVQYYDGETRSWDVRTKRVTYDIVPTIDGVIGLANYGPTATLFTLGRNHTVQQYDVSPMSVPLQVQSVQHAPANTPPTPPTTLEEQNNPYSGPSLPTAGKPDLLSGRRSDTASSTDESTATSPLDKIAREMDSLDQLQSEIRDKITPLSPTSSRASSTSSQSSGGATHQRKYLYDRPSSSRSSNVTGYEGTEFSLSAASPNHLRDSMSIRSGSTKASQSRYRSSSLRREILRSPEESNAHNAMMDLFPFLKAHILDVPLQTPHYGETARTSDMLQREMLSVVFGWNDTAANLVRDEMSKHRVGSASAVLLAKWLGDMGAENMPSLIGSQSMTSSDWMLLALSSIGQDSQKRVGEAFVQRLLEKGDIHPAVAILLGLGELNDAIEVYVSQSYFMEAVLLSSLCLPTDWGRQIYLLRKWGEVAVKSGEPELAVRIFSCASAETTVPWTSPKAQDAVFAARQQHEESMGSASAGALNSPPLSPPSRTASGRLKAKNAPLKLITTFGDKGNPMKPTADDPTPLAVGVTPIITSAMSPGSWREGPGSRAVSSARTATPGGFGGRRRLPSRTDIARVKQEAADLASPMAGPKGLAIPNQAAAGSQGRRTPSVSDAEEPTTALRASRRDMADLASTSGASDRLPSPSLGSLARIRAASRSGHHSREKSKDGMRIQVVETREIDVHPPRATADSQTSGASHQASAERRGDIATPPLTSTSLQSSKAKAIDDYINSVEEARLTKRHIRTASRARADHRSRSRADHQTEKAVGKGRETPESRGRAEARYVAPAKKSPSSPIPMSPEEIAEANAREAEAASHEAENFYKLASPIESKDSHHSRPVSGRDGFHDDNAKTVSTHAGADHQLQSPGPQSMHRNDSRGRHKARGPGSSTRSPSSPLPMLVEARHDKDNDETRSDGNRMRTRAYSSAGRDTTPKRAASSNRVHERSRSQKPPQRSQTSQGLEFDAPNQAEVTETFHARMANLRRPLTRKEIAARELEERRLSLARRPSAPAIPLPSDLLPIRPAIGIRSHTDLDNSPRSMTPPYPRSATADSDIQARYGKATITPTTPAQIGLPATPRAMKHPHFLKPDSLDPDAPPVPAISGSVSSHTGSLLSQVTGSNLSQFAPSSLSQAGPSSSSQVSSSLVSDPPRDAEEDTVGQLLPATVFGKPNNQGMPRAASAPLENSTGPKAHAATKTGQAAHSRRLSTGRGQVRMISPPESPVYETDNKSQIASIDHAIHSNSDQHIIVLDQGSEDDPVLLPELQHLATPPPPPPPPSFYQYIQSTRSEVGVPAIEGNTSVTATATSGTASDLSSGPSTLPQYPYSMERASTASPTSHRRGHGSISESFGSRMRGVADRMRGHSRSRAKSPPMLEAIAYVPPYETVLPTDTMGHSRKKSVGRAKSPYEQAMADQQNSMPPPPPPAPGPPAPEEETKVSELAVPPRSKSAKDVGYRHPKEVRANMPPEQLQSGAQGAGSAGFL